MTLLFIETVHVFNIHMYFLSMFTSWRPYAFYIVLQAARNSTKCDQSYGYQIIVCSLQFKPENSANLSNTVALRRTGQETKLTIYSVRTLVNTHDDRTYNKTTTYSCRRRLVHLNEVGDTDGQTNRQRVRLDAGRRRVRDHLVDCVSLYAERAKNLRN